MNFRVVIGTAIILVGLGFLIDFPFLNIFFALLLIYLGIRFISGKTFGLNLGSRKTVDSEVNRFNRVMVFTSTRIQSHSKEFAGGELVTVFGEGEVDLREAQTSRASNKLELVSVFGSLNLRVPSDWEVTSEEGVGVLGSFNNATAHPETPKSKLHIEGAAVFGSIQITN